ncbi:hypothetical protein PR048_009373 [Dryococelus australis]|uniref:Uncharacterized protein n=1 Tax=Dryococelus australis TaxID=614101 RepID=A0ABQ9I1J2_9NEOP|nr:hypothetical protein PR048_009373 [Dryococelus australis]
MYGSDCQSKSQNLGKGDWQTRQARMLFALQKVVELDTFVDPTTGKLKRQGALIRPGRICSTLRSIAQHGGDDLYTGSLAKMLTEDIEHMGGIITEEDLHNYK